MRTPRLGAWLLVALLLAGCSAPRGTLSTASVDDANRTSDAPPLETLPFNGTAGSGKDLLPTPTPEASPEPAIPASPENASVNATPATPTPATPLAPPPFVLRAVSATSRSIEAGGAGVVVRGLAGAGNASRVRSISVRASLPGAPDLVASHDVTAIDLARGTEPAAFGADGCRAWRADSATVGFACQLVPPRGAPEGDYAVSIHARGDDGDDASSDGPPLHVSPMTLVQVASSAVDASGNVTVGGWGGWAAEPGAGAVAARNFIKLVNAGDDPRARVVVDLGASGFRGAQDPSFVIPTVGNLEFAWWEDKTGTASPSQGTFTWHAASGQSSDAIQFTAKGSVVYVTYRIKAMPAVLPVQPYTAAFTVTEA